MRWWCSENARITAAAMAEGYRTAARTAPWPDRLRLVATAGWWASVAEQIGRRSTKAPCSTTA